jgi:hypothetical protein
MPPKPNVLVGNMGLFYVCYELSKMGWNCLPTSRNAKGIDLIIYSQDAKKTHTIQVKSLSRKNPVPFGATSNLMAELLVICRLNLDDEIKTPDLYVLTKDEVEKALDRRVNEKGKVSYWLQPHSLEGYKDWESRFESGFSVIE